MKTEILKNLDSFEEDLRKLRKAVFSSGERITSTRIRSTAEELATRWVEELRSPLEHKFKIATETIEHTSQAMKQLHVLSRPNNRKSSYVKTLDAVLRDFKNKFVLPIQQMATGVENVFDLHKLVAGLADRDESDYLKEAIDCANANFCRAAIVLGWCAAINRIQKKILLLGFNAFNAASVALKQQTSGRHKRWNKQFNVTSLGELQEVFDTDLITVCEGLQLLESNQADRLKDMDFQWRNHSAHPGEAPIEPAHLVAFFTDINSIVLTNPKFSMKAA
jgi:hypothetical protein